MTPFDENRIRIRAGHQASHQVMGLTPSRASRTKSQQAIGFPKPPSHQTSPLLTDYRTHIKIL